MVSEKRQECRERVEGKTIHWIGLIEPMISGWKKHKILTLETAKYYTYVNYNSRKTFSTKPNPVP